MYVKGRESNLPGWPRLANDLPGICRLPGDEKAKLFSKSGFENKKVFCLVLVMVVAVGVGHVCVVWVVGVVAVVGNNTHTHTHIQTLTHSHGYTKM